MSAFPALFKNVGIQSSSFLESYLKLGTVSAKDVSGHSTHLSIIGDKIHISFCFSQEDNGLRDRGTRELYKLGIALQFSIDKCFEQSVMH